MPDDAICRVRALREARRRALDLPDHRWQWVASYAWPHLTEAQRTNAEAILVAVRAIAPKESRRPAESHGFSEQQIRKAAETVRARTDKAPTRVGVAQELHTSESTLRRAMKGLEMAGWPPAGPED